MMSLEPRMVLNGTDEQASRQKRKDELAARVEELGLFDKIKGWFTEGDHPRGSDGRFAKKGSLGKEFEKLKPGVNSIKARQNYKKNLAALNADQDQWLKDAIGQWNSDVSNAQKAYDAATKADDVAAKNANRYHDTAAQGAAAWKAALAATDVKSKAFIALNDLKQSKPSLADYPKEREAKFPLS